MRTGFDFEFDSGFDFGSCGRVGGDLDAEGGGRCGGEAGFDGVDGFPGEFVYGVYYVV